MSFMLFSERGGEDVHMTSLGWHDLLDLAQRHGWEPAGTLPPVRRNQNVPAGEWNGCYCCQDCFQRVTQEDAAALAAALEAGAKAEPEMAEFATKVAEFCRRGGFKIS